MSRFPMHRIDPRLAVTLLLGVIGLALVLGLGPGESLTWAAPGQDAYLQTMPTRPSTPPAEPTPAPEATRPGSEQDDDDDDDEGPPAPPPVEDTPSPTPSPVEKLPSPVPQDTATPTPVPSSGPVTTALPSTTAPASRPDLEAEVATETAGEIDVESAPPSSPLPTPSPTALASPLPPPTLPSTATPLPTTPSSRPAPEMTDSGPVSESDSVSDQRGSPAWLCGLGLGVVLLVGGIILLRRS